MRILFALPGLHRVQRGAEVAFLSVASELARMGEQVTLIGSGPELPGTPYKYIRVPAMKRERFERFPKLPMFRDETAWEEVTFAFGLLSAYQPANFDVTVACSFPFTNLVLRRPVVGHKRPPHVFVTQNGDWPAQAQASEYRLFNCDGLVCINPDFQQRNSSRYRTALIPNGVDLSRFKPGAADRQRFGFEDDRHIVLMVSALIGSKNVEQAVRAVAKLPDTRLVVAGDGPLRDEISRLAADVMPGRYSRLTLSADQMPVLYNSVDAFLHLSRDESFGNVYVEALASGLPIVAFDLPRTRWILGDNAFYAQDGIEAITSSLKDALSRQHEGSRAVARAREFGWPVIAGKYRCFFEEILSARP